MFNIQEAYKSVEDFNLLAGNLHTVDEESIDAQVSFIFSELEETITAFEERDAVELADGCADIIVTAFGLMQKLEVAGFDMLSVLKKVCENNMEKFPLKGEFLQYNKDFTATLNKEFGRYVIKDIQGKVRKHSNFVEVDIAELVPTNFFQKGNT